MALGTILAVGSTVAKIAGSRRRDKDINNAQINQQNVERKIRAEQGVRERTRQVRQARVASAQGDANSAAQGGSSSGASNTQASVASDLAFNLDTINFNMASSNALTGAEQKTMNAGKPTAFESLNEAVSPLILGNVANINSTGSSIWDSFFGPADPEVT